MSGGRALSRTPAAPRVPLSAALFVAALVAAALFAAARPASARPVRRSVPPSPRASAASEARPPAPSSEPPGAPPAPGASSARAPERRFQLAFRSGFGVPLGSYANARQLSGFRQANLNQLADDTYGAVPLWLDVGYRLSSHVLLGAYGMYGLVLPKRADRRDPLGGGCPQGADCSASGVRFGLQAQYAFLPEGFASPWLGVGLGYEWITSEINGEALGFQVRSRASYGGFELLQLQGGLDLRVAERASVGPFLSASALQYQSCGAELDGADTACRIAEAAWHGWLVFGVRATLAL